jgi:hypothetical protein
MNWSEGASLSQITIYAFFKKPLALWQEIWQNSVIGSGSRQIEGNGGKLATLSSILRAFPRNFYALKLCPQYLKKLYSTLNRGTQWLGSSKLNCSLKLTAFGETFNQIYMELHND